MNKPIIEIQGDDVVCLTPLPQYGDNFSKYELVMTKEIFIECYNRWIKGEKKIEPKTGHREYNDIFDHYLCGNCKTIVMDYDNFCPNCGCRMVKPQESEVSDADSD